MQEIIEMTPEEKQLFRSFVIRESRLESGQLTKPEIQALSDLRLMLECLGHKYPSFQLEAVSFQPGWSVASSPELTFRRQGDDTYCTAILEQDSSGTHHVSDNLWGLLVQDEAAHLVEQVINCDHVAAVIRSLTGDQITESLSYQAACAQGVIVIPHYRVTVLPSQLPPRLLDDWQEALVRARVSGFFQFYFSVGDQSEPPIYFGSLSIPYQRRNQKEVSSCH